MTEIEAKREVPSKAPSGAQEITSENPALAAPAAGQVTKLVTRQIIRPDICVIGAGAGGRAAAAAAAASGVNVVLIDNGEMAAAKCTGAVAVHALIAAAAHVQAMRNGARFGVKSPRFGIDFAAVRGHVHAAVAALAPLSSRERFIGLGVRVVEGASRFTDRETVAGGDFDIKARRFVIAAGSSPAIPEIAGLAGVPYLTSETVFELAECPRQLIVVGAGSVALELAQAFARLGADVTVLEEAKPLQGDDAECAALVLDALACEGVKLRAGVRILQVRQTPAGVSANLATGIGEGPHQETIEGTHILVAVGRRPDLEGLALDTAGVRYSLDSIAVDRRLRSSNDRVYAIGEAAGAPPSPHIAEHQAGLVVRNALFRTPIDGDRSIVPLVTHTDPELARVGLTEDEARARAGAIRVLRWSYRDNDRAQADGATDGHIKIVTDRKGTILGATIVGAGAAENIALWLLAINQKLNIGAVAGVPAPYPTYAEVGKRAAMTYFSPGLTSPLVRRIIGWLRRFG
jgi:pyruvate/2-oxoglutarate dehydrogenase complex dihydrolipoamide dehydrogenase (E3) component